jgi:hypothetical protein
LILLQATQQRCTAYSLCFLWERITCYNHFQHSHPHAKLITDFHVSCHATTAQTMLLQVSFSSVSRFCFSITLLHNTACSLSISPQRRALQPCNILTQDRSTLYKKPSSLVRALPSSIVYLRDRVAKTAHDLVT